MKTIILLLACLSCSKKSEIEEQFVASKNDYWQYKNYCSNNGRGIYFQFKENGSYDKYLQYINEGFSLFNNDGDLQSGPRTWSIKNDSIFLLDNGTYKIEKTSKNEILLSYYHHEIKDKKCYVRLSKWVNTPKGPKLLDQPDNIKK